MRTREQPKSCSTRRSTEPPASSTGVFWLGDAGSGEAERKGLLAFGAAMAGTLLTEGGVLESYMQVAGRC